MLKKCACSSSPEVRSEAAFARVAGSASAERRVRVPVRDRNEIYSLLSSSN